MDAVEVYPPETDEIELDYALEVLKEQRYTQEEIAEMDEEEIIILAQEILDDLCRPEE